MLYFLSNCVINLFLSFPHPNSLVDCGLYSSTPAPQLREVLEGVTS